VPSEQPVVIVPSYDGSRRLPNLTPLLALWLAREGLPVLVHGPLAEPGRVCTAAILNVIGLAPILQTEDIARAWSRREPAFLPTALLCPPLQTLLDLRLRVGLRGPGHTVARMLNPVQRAPALRLVSHSRAEVGALMSAWAAREGADAQLLPGTEGQPVADPRRQPRIDTWLGGALQTAFSAPAHDGPVAEWPLLPVATDTASAAVYVQEVLSGMRPAPAPLVRQAALIAAAVQALRQRQGALALSA
jgi:anthranilate phosphoribosyltransferase